MELNVIWKHARTAALECCEGSVYEMEEPCRISFKWSVLQREQAGCESPAGSGAWQRVSCFCRNEGKKQLRLCSAQITGLYIECAEFWCKGCGSTGRYDIYSGSDHVMPEKQSCADSGRNVSSDQSVSERSSHNGAGKRCSAFGIYRA